MHATTYDVNTHPFASAACCSLHAMSSSTGCSTSCARRTCGTNDLDMSPTYMHRLDNRSRSGLRRSGVEARMQPEWQHTKSSCVASASSTRSNWKGRCDACDRPRTAKYDQNICLLAVRCGKYMWKHVSNSSKCLLWLCQNT